MKMRRIYHRPDQQARNQVGYPPETTATTSLTNRPYRMSQDLPSDSVFVQFQEDQPIKTMGEGSLFVLYEYDGVHYSSASDDEDGGYSPDNYGTIDGLAGAGGRL